VRFVEQSFGGTHELRIGDELVVPPSSGWDVTRTFPTAGTCIFYCSLHGTPEAGMRGTLTVTPVGPPPTTPTNTTPTPPPTPPPPLPPLLTGAQGATTSAPALSRRTRHPRIVYRVEHWWAWNNRGTTPTLLSLSLNRPRTTVRVSCRGRGCPFRTRTRVISQRRVDLAPWFRRAAMATGTRIRVLLVKRGHIGQSLEFRLRRQAVPRLTKRCVPSGSQQPGLRCT
jgi:hypothetical protein